MVLPPPIVELFSREARFFWGGPYFFVKRHVKKITTPASKCCITFDQTGVLKQGIILKRMKSSTPWDVTWNSRRGTQWPRGTKTERNESLCRCICSSKNVKVEARPQQRLSLIHI